LWLIISTAFILTGIQFTLVGYWVLFIHEGLGYSIRFSSYMFSLALLVGIFGRVFWGTISDRLFNSHRKKTFVAVVLLTGMMCLSIFFLSIGTPMWILVVLSCLAGFTAMGWHGLFVVTVSELAGGDLAGAAVGIAITVAHTGALIIQPFFGLIVDITDSYFIGWLMLAIISLVGVVLIGNIQEKKSVNDNQPFSSES
jgi:MFS family permease